MEFDRGRRAVTLRDMNKFEVRRLQHHPTVDDLFGIVLQRSCQAAVRLPAQCEGLFGRPFPPAQFTATFRPSRKFGRRRIELQQNCTQSGAAPGRRETIALTDRPSAIMRPSTPSISMNLRTRQGWDPQSKRPDAVVEHRLPPGQHQFSAIPDQAGGFAAPCRRPIAACRVRLRRSRPSSIFRRVAWPDDPR